jgi:5'-3' exonuclease
MKNILILDGYNLFYRALYSGMDKGEYSTVFNFFRGLKPLIEMHKPEEVFLVLEGYPKKRFELYKEYKANREIKTDDSFIKQRKIIVNILNEFFPIQLVRHKDYECDDIIAYLANLNKNENVTIVSTDTDFIQIISENIKLYNPVKKSFIEKTEYDYAVWKSLKGDSADNIIGFKGVGDKTAKKYAENLILLNEFLSYNNNKEIFDKNLFLIKFHDLNEDKDSIIFYDKPVCNNWDALRDKFKEFGFNSIVEKDESWKKYINCFNKLFKEN